jgi:DNA-binding transcriptional MerR regulator
MARPDTSYYSANLLPRLNLLLVFKELGFSLDEIALLLQENLDLEEVRKALDNRRNELSRRIAQDNARLEQVESWLTQIEREGRIPSYEITLRQVAPRLVASLRDRLASYDEAEELFHQAQPISKRA